jgi:diadenosine tetraphosphate (Ap4A) HIT family hydrolase
MNCELCEHAGGEIIWQDAECRVVLIDDLEYPGFCRVIWLQHVREMTDLSEQQRGALMEVVFAVEETLRTTLQPDKINLASLGNMTPHLHWHVIPRFVDDKHFPGAIWGSASRASSASATAASARLDDFRVALKKRLNGVKAIRER